MKSRVVEIVIGTLVILLVLGQLLAVPTGLAFVETGSMEPTMEPGDGFIALPPSLLGGVEDGDVITFNAQNIEDGRLTTHRIVDKTPDGYITLGDANTFTDQQAGEPPVPRDRIVAEALQINGHLVVLPNFGDYVEAIRGIFAFIGSRFDLSVSQVISFVLVASIAAYFLGESGVAGDKRTDRSTGRQDGISGLLLVGGTVVLVLATATLSMTAASGGIAIPYDSVSPGDAGQGGIPAGATKNASVEIRNSGVIPMTAILSTDNPDAELGQERITLAPRENATVNVSITAPAEPGNYEVTVERNQYLAVLPTGILAKLSAVSHWVTVLTVDLLLALGVGVIGAKLVGGGRLRLRPTRPVPFEVRLIRWVRSLYK